MEGQFNSIERLLRFCSRYPLPSTSQRRVSSPSSLFLLSSATVAPLPLLAAAGSLSRDSSNSFPDSRRCSFCPLLLPSLALVAAAAPPDKLLWLVAQPLPAPS